MMYKNYWVKTASNKGMKVREWAFSKLDEKIAINTIFQAVDYTLWNRNNITHNKK